MFNFLKSKKTGETITLKLSGLHCASCSLNIDGEIEELSGVVSSNTSYARQESVITYDPALAKPDSFIKIIEGLGYKVIS
jgi:Cu+-exporting ATPase